VEMHSGRGSASMVVLFSGGVRWHMTPCSCRFEMLLLGLLWVCVGFGFCYGPWVFIFLCLCFNG
jgi:fatty acid desaturase